MLPDQFLDLIRRYQPQRTHVTAMFDSNTRLTRLRIWGPPIDSEAREFFEKKIVAHVGPEHEIEFEWETWSEAIEDLVRVIDREIHTYGTLRSFDPDSCFRSLDGVDAAEVLLDVLLEAGVIENDIAECSPLQRKRRHESKMVEAIKWALAGGACDGAHLVTDKLGAWGSWDSPKLRFIVGFDKATSTVRIGAADTATGRWTARRPMVNEIVNGIAHDVSTHAIEVSRVEHEIGVVFIRRMKEVYPDEHFEVVPSNKMTIDTLMKPW